MEGADRDKELLPFAIPLELDEGGSVRLYLIVEPLNGNQYRVLEPVQWSLFSFGDIMEAEQDNDGRYQWKRTVEEADVVSATIEGVRQEYYEHETRGALNAEIVNLGGQWEMPVSGILYVEIPAEVGIPNGWQERYHGAIGDLQKNSDAEL